MLDDIITLAVDELNDTNTVDHVFSRFEEYQNRSVYTEAIHSVIARDTLSFYRTFPKVMGNFKGTAKSAMKFSKDYSVEGVDGVASLTSPLIIEVSCSVPVGIAVADQLIGRQRVIALMDGDALMVKLMNQLMV
jgi:hypothetical protein